MIGGGIRRGATRAAMLRPARRRRDDRRLLTMRRQRWPHAIMRMPAAMDQRRQRYHRRQADPSDAIGAVRAVHRRIDQRGHHEWRQHVDRSAVVRSAAAPRGSAGRSAAAAAGWSVSGGGGRVTSVTGGGAAAGATLTGMQTLSFDGSASAGSPAAGSMRTQFGRPGGMPGGNCSVMLSCRKSFGRSVTGGYSQATSAPVGVQIQGADAFTGVAPGGIVSTSRGAPV